MKKDEKDKEKIENKENDEDNLNEDVIAYQKEVYVIDPTQEN